MSPFRLLSAAEQVAERLRQEILRGLRRGEMCGSDLLAAELGIARKTAETALLLLEREGLLVGRGQRCRRHIASPDVGHGVYPLRIIVFTQDTGGQNEPLINEVVSHLREAGHAVSYADKSLFELGMNPKRILQHAKKCSAQCLILLAASREVLEAVAAGPIPAFAIFGARSGVPIASAGPDKTKAMISAVQALTGQGHTRISLLCRGLHRKPRLNSFVQTFVTELNKQGIRTGDFNLPDWVETPAGLNECLGHLFRLTPPTALIIDEIPFFVATQQFLAHRAIRVTDDVSLLCIENDVALSFCDLSIAHIDWNVRPVLRHVVRWAASVSRGKPEVRQITTTAVFVPGGSIGPAPVVH